MTHRYLLAAALVGFLTPSVAAAQSSDAQRAFVSVYFGTQLGERDLDDGFDFTAYEETATVDASQTYKGGKFIALGGGVKVAGQFFVGAQLTNTGKDATTTATASIPHPLIFNRPRTATATADDFVHKERALHLLAGYWLPVNRTFDIMLSGGPTFFSVKHELVTGVNFSEAGFPFSTVNLTSLTGSEEEEGATGFNVGLDATFRFNPTVGIAGFGRFSKGSVDLPGAGTGTVKVDVGGMQLGVGVRLAF